MTINFSSAIVAMPVHYRNVVLLTLSVLMVVSGGFVSETAAKGQRLAAPVDAYNVVWDSPSKDSRGSMPIGNGDIGMNVWVEENGDLLFFISKTDSWSDNGRLLKLGQVRVRLTPSLVAQPFRQELQLRQGRIVIDSGAAGMATTLRIWVDANRPVIHIEGESQQDMQAQVSLRVWRTADRDFQRNFSALGVCRGGIPIIEKADVVLPPKDNRIVWYHRNELSIYPLTMKVQGLESLISMVPDQLLHRTFGGCISGEGLVQTEAADATQTLKTSAPTRHLDVAIHVLTACPVTPDQWLEQLNGIITETRKTDLAKAWSEHCRWWEDFWNRSWIDVRTPEDDAPATLEQENERRATRAKLSLFGKDGYTYNVPILSGDPAGRVLSSGYTLQRFITAASGRGAYPIKHNGSIFTVNTRDPKNLADADYRQWGPNYWFQNTRLVYWPMLRSGDYEMMLPLFAMYRAIVPMAEARTKLYYQHEGIFFPETIYPWGVYPPDEYSKAREWDRQGRPIHLTANPYIRYYWSGGLELTAMMLDYYDGTRDEGFLRDTLLSTATGVTTFFDQHWKRDENGMIRFDPAQSLETWHTAVNPLPEIAGLRFVLPRLLALPRDVTTAEQRADWKRLLSELPPVPTGEVDGLEVLRPAESFSNHRNLENPELYAIFPYRICAVGRPGLDLGVRTFEKFVPMPPREVSTNRNDAGRVGCWVQTPIQAAFLGKTAQAAAMVVTIFAAHNPDSRFFAFWGPNHDWIPDQDHGGVGMMALQSMLLQVDGKKIYLFPAWPREWNVNFKLHAPYNTTVQGELRDGKVTSLTVTPKSRMEDIVNMLGR